MELAVRKAHLGQRSQMIEKKVGHMSAGSRHLQAGLT
jgi:hypothetical protein